VTLGSRGRRAYVRAGETIEAGTPVAGVIRSLAGVKCSGVQWDYLTALRSKDAIERFAAAKTAGVLGDRRAVPYLEEIAQANTDERITLEAWSALVRINGSGAKQLEAEARDPAMADAMRMEAVLCLSELTSSDPSAAALSSIAADANCSSELRAAAVWGLGLTGHDRFDLVWRHVDELDEKVRHHAVEALGTPSCDDVRTLVRDLASNDVRAAVAARILARDVRVSEMVGAAMDDATQDWAVQALGQVPPAQVAGLADVLPSHLLQGVRALWRQNFTDWTQSGLVAAELDFVGTQTVRVSPTAFI